MKQVGTFGFWGLTVAHITRLKCDCVVIYDPTEGEHWSQRVYGGRKTLKGLRACDFSTQSTRPNKIYWEQGQIVLFLMEIVWLTVGWEKLWWENETKLKEWDFQLIYEFKSVMTRLFYFLNNSFCIKIHEYAITFIIFTKTYRLSNLHSLGVYFWQKFREAFHMFTACLQKHSVYNFISHHPN